MAVDGGRDYLRRIGTGWVDTSILALVEGAAPIALVMAGTFTEQLRTGWRPLPDDYDDAPLLKDWRTHERRIGRRPEVILIGMVTGHPDFPDGTLIAMCWPGTKPGDGPAPPAAPIGSGTGRAAMNRFELERDPNWDDAGIHDGVAEIVVIDITGKRDKE